MSSPEASKPDAEIRLLLQPRPQQAQARRPTINTASGGSENPPPKKERSRQKAAHPNGRVPVSFLRATHQKKSGECCQVQDRRKVRCHCGTPVKGLKTIGSLQNGKEGERGGEKKVKEKMPLPSYRSVRGSYTSQVSAAVHKQIMMTGKTSTLCGNRNSLKATKRRFEKRSEIVSYW